MKNNNSVDTYIQKLTEAEAAKSDDPKDYHEAILEVRNELSSVQSEEREAMLTYLCSVDINKRTLPQQLLMQSLNILARRDNLTPEELGEYDKLMTIPYDDKEKEQREELLRLQTKLTSSTETGDNN